MKIVRVGFAHATDIEDGRGATYGYSGPCDYSRDDVRGPGIEIWSDNLESLIFIPMGNIKLIKEVIE